MGSCIEIRILGRLRVRRPDGSIVDNAEWRTGKTADLVRLLALAGGRPVRVETLLDSLWPSVGEAKARASLRTAASQIRRTLGADCVERTFDGLTLTNVWIDSDAFSVLAHEARAHARGSHHAQVVRIAREAEALYVGDLDCHVAGDETWVSEARETLASLRRDLLTEAAESALALRWYRDAEDFATRALRADRMAERPHRLLMSAYAGLGETDRALRVFDRCRRLLADELGVDPSPLTQAVHLQVLSGAPATRQLTLAEPPASATDPVEKVVTAAVRQDGPHLVGLRGQAGSGRCEIIAAVSERLSQQGWQVVRLESTDSVMPNLATPDDGRPVLVTLPCIDELSWHRLEQVAGVLATLRHRRAVAAAPVSFDVLTRVHGLRAAGVDVVEHEVGPMTHEALESLAEDVLGSHVAESLVARLLETSGGLFSRAVAALHGWLADGSIVSTSSGLVVTGADDQSLREGAAHVWAPLHTVQGADADLAATLAALRAPASATRLSKVLSAIGQGIEPGALRDALDRLVDAEVLQVGDGGYEFRHPLVRDGAECWLRPSARHQLHRSLAVSPVLGPEERAHQWMLAGEPEEALAALLDAADLAAQCRLEERTSTLLQRAFRVAGGSSWAPYDQLEAFESVGRAAARLGSTDLARHAFERGAEVAVSVDPASALRLRNELDGLVRPTLVPVQWHPEGGREAASQTG